MRSIIPYYPYDLTDRIHIITAHLLLHIVVVDDFPVYAYSIVVVVWWCIYFKHTT